MISCCHTLHLSGSRVFNLLVAFHGSSLLPHSWPSLLAALRHSTCVIVLLSSMASPSRSPLLVPLAPQSLNVGRHQTQSSSIVSWPTTLNPLGTSCNLKDLNPRTNEIPNLIPSALTCLLNSRLMYATATFSWTASQTFSSSKKMASSFSRRLRPKSRFSQQILTVTFPKHISWIQQSLATITYQLHPSITYKPLNLSPCLFSCHLQTALGSSV